jgi:hypothetical protein
LSAEPDREEGGLQSGLGRAGQGRDHVSGIEIPEHYHRETWELIRKVITDISNAASAKVP